MAYFLKKSNLKKGIYLQIYESFYDPNKKNTVHKSYKAIGYVEELIESGISDPIAYYSDVVNQMNAEAKRVRKDTLVIFFCKISMTISKFPIIWS